MTEILQNFALLFGGLFALFMLLIGAVLAGIGLFIMQRQRAAAAWPQAAAVIEVSEVIAERHFEGNLYFRPIIRYRYSAPGGSYSGDQLATSNRLYPKESTAQKVTARYPVGSTVMARYNPANPAEAVLERGASGGIWFFLFGLPCWIVPVIAALNAEISPRLIAAGLGGLVLIIFLVLLRSGSSLRKARLSGRCPPAGNCTDGDVAALLFRGEKILAIQLYRELHPCGLKEAKEAVEAMDRTTRPPGA